MDTKDSNKHDNYNHFFNSIAVEFGLTFQMHQAVNNVNNKCNQAFNLSDLTKLFSAETEDILTATAVKKFSLPSKDRFNTSFDSDYYLCQKINKRFDFVQRYLLKTTEFIKTRNPDFFKNNKNISIKTLGGDSHNEGSQPLHFYTDSGESFVVKNTDPRPYVFLYDLLSLFSQELNLDLTPPQVYTHKNFNQFYLLPFIKHFNRYKNQDQINQFMIRLGAVTFIAYLCCMTDLHVENLIVYNNIPLIIDPECIWYPLDDAHNSNLLMQTGFLSTDIQLSSTRGGDKVLLQLDKNVDKSGKIRYMKNLEHFENRIVDMSGNYVDPGDHHHQVMIGFRKAFDYCLKNKSFITKFILSHLDPELRTRYLIRKTKHYKLTSEVLHLPQEKSYIHWQEHVFYKFKQSYCFPDKISQDVISWELHDIKYNDIPYFWIQANSNAIEHPIGGIVDIYSKNSTALERVTPRMYCLNQQEMDICCSHYEKFLKQSIHNRLFNI